MPIYGYARVSTLDQDLGLQHAALKAAGCKVVRAEKVSGTRRDGRTELQVLLDFVQHGDTLVVTRIDRLARSMKDLQDIVHELKQKGVALRATEQPVDTSTATGKAFLDMLECSPSSRLTCAESANSKGSGPRRPVEFTRDVNRASIRLKSGACETRKSLGLRPSRVALGSVGPASIGCLGRRALREATVWRYGFASHRCKTPLRKKGGMFREPLVLHKRTFLASWLKVEWSGIGRWSIPPPRTVWSELLATLSW